MTLRWGEHSKPAHGATSRLPWGGGSSLGVLVPLPRHLKSMPEAPTREKPSRGPSAGSVMAKRCGGTEPCWLPG